LANNNNKGLEGYGEPGQQFGAQGWQVAQRYAGQDYTSGGVANTDGRDAGTERLQRSGQHRQQQEVCRPVPDIAAGPVNGIWRAADWLFCRDGKWRPVEPGTFPLAHGAASRVGRLRAYGNAINVEAAKEFILAYQEAVALKGLMQ
jgi:DNA (cytosine-5)-methyltransferase 1